MGEPGDNVSGNAEKADGPVVFVSYSRKNSGDADKIAEILRTRGYRVTRDTEDIMAAEPWRKRLLQLIGESDKILFLLSMESAESKECAWEVQRATSLNKQIVPVAIEEVDEAGIPPLLTELQIINCTSEASYPAAIDEICAALDTDIGWVREHTRIDRLAAAWEASGRPNRLLVRGEDIVAAEKWLAGRTSTAPKISARQSDFIQESRRFSVRRQRYWITGTAAIAIVTAGLAALAFLQSIEAERQRDTAIANEQLAEDRRIEAEKQRDRADTESANARKNLGTAITALSDSERKDGKAVEAALLGLAAMPLVKHREDAHRKAISAIAASVRNLHERRRFHHAGEDGPDGQPRNYSVVAVDYSSDGRNILSVSDDNVASIRRADNGEVQHTVDLLIWLPTVAAFSPDGAGVAIGDGNGFLFYWFPESGELLSWERENDWVTGIAFAPDPPIIATASAGGEISIRSLPDGNLIRRFDLGDRIPESISFLDAPAEIAVGLDNGSIQVRSVDTGVLLRDTPGDDSPVTGLATSPGRATLASASADGSISIWQTTGMRRSKTIQAHPGGVTAISFSDNGRRLATAGKDNAIRIWDTSNGDPISTMSGHTEIPTSVALSPDGALAVSGSHDGTLRFWTSELAPRLANHALDEPIHHISFIEEAGTLAVATDQKVLLFGKQIERDGQQLDLNGRLPAGFIELPDGNLGVFLQDGSIRLLDGRSDDVLDESQLAGRSVSVATAFPPTSMAFSLDDRNILILTFGSDEMFSQEITGFASPATRMTFNGSGSRLAIGHYSDKVVVWNMETGALDRALITNGHRNTGLSFAPDGRMLAVASAAFEDDISPGFSVKSVQLWDTQDYTVEFELLHDDSIEALAFSPDGSRLATGRYSGEVSLWDMATRTEILRLPTGQDMDPVFTLAFDSSGKRLAAGTMEGRLVIWDLADLGQEDAVSLACSRLRFADPHVILAARGFDVADAARASCSQPDE